MKTDLRGPVKLLLALMLSGSVLAAQQSTADGNTKNSNDARAAASSTFLSICHRLSGAHCAPE
jgi:hypothetical protein